ncbi:uncharacterized protein LOC120267515 [Dioscorea cayenensis subsp. rotundata]|uniref:Uncharacterized protein LOC120267515 n=1 Tax=Dioscorea cayennensis subsp. rotundata TaxID=55577 RepID=A0AB40BVJ6_DIOCR|nr:uncharacterized protein LOC120267515 [Dioscorea cayenensis subsp. rotundata]
MPDAFQCCFRPAGSSPAPTQAGPTVTTSVYETTMGLVALSWSRTLLGLSLRIDLRLHDSPAFTFRVRPRLLWRRRGRRRLPLPGSSSSISLSWDLSHSIFPSSSSPEPSHFSLSLSLDSLPLLLLGDSSSPPPLISRRERIVLSDAHPFKTTARFAGQDHEISISFDLHSGGERDSISETKEKKKDREAGMRLWIDGGMALHVRRIKWKFRGSERVDLNGFRIRVSWDLHNWFFSQSGSEPDEAGRAVLLIRFENSDGDGEGYFGKDIEGAFRETEGCFGKSWDWSDKSSGENGKKIGSRRMTSSSSSASSSSASSASSSSVMEWASAEETQLKSAQGFSLLVYAWR